MQGKILALLMLVAVMATGRCDEVRLNPSHPTTYTVVKGDTLWDISGRFLVHPWQWPDIWHVNPQITNPNLIYPGDVLALTYQDGKPILSLSRRGALGGRNVKLTPGIREVKHENAIPPIPLDAIQQFLSRPLVVTEKQIAEAPYIVGAQDGHLTTGKGTRVYVRGLTDQSVNKYSVYRPGGAYKDPATGTILGYEALHVGDVVIERFGDTASAIVTSSNREILKGDRIMVQYAEEYPEFVPHPPAADVDGHIIAVVDGVLQIGQYNVVVLNKGTQDGLELGTVLAIYQAGAIVKDDIAAQLKLHKDMDAAKAAEDQAKGFDKLAKHVANDVRAGKLNVDTAFGERIGGQPEAVQLPAERAGELMIFRTFDNLSYALVMNTQRPVHVLDKVRKP